MFLIWAQNFNSIKRLYEMLCASWLHLHNFKRKKNTQRGVLFLVTLQVATLLKVPILHGCFYVFQTVQVVSNHRTHHNVSVRSVPTIFNYWFIHYFESHLSDTRQGTNSYSNTSNHLHLQSSSTFRDLSPID